MSRLIHGAIANTITPAAIATAPMIPTIVVANAESSSPQQELVKDLLSIVHVFLVPAVWTTTPEK